ncbi:MAG: leucine-rich repeat domain-containing protein [Treponema sp.]
MMKRLLKGAAVLTVLAALIMTSSCKQAVTASEKKNTIAPAETISLTIEGDNGITVKTATLTVDKGSSWKNIKAGAKAAVIVKEDYELTGWKFGGAGGTDISDNTAFTSGSIVFAVSKKKGTLPAKKISLTIKGDAGITVKNETLTADIGAVWKDIKSGVNGAVIVKEDYELTGWKFGGAGGTAISDKQAFKSDSIVFAVSKKKGIPAADEITITLTGDERVRASSFTIPKGTAWKEARGRAEAAFTLKAEWQGGDYGAYRWHHTNESGTVLADDYKLKENEKIYVRTNYIKFKIEDTQLTGYTGEKPRGRITIPADVKTIGSNAFAKCFELKRVYLESGVQTIGSYAFYRCFPLTGTLIIPDSVQTIEESAFAGCSGLTGLTIGSGVQIIRSGAFAGCSGLTGTLAIPDSVTSIGDGAFYGCTKLTGLTIGSGVQTIGIGAFAGCVRFSGVLTIPDSVRSIGRLAFTGCAELTGVHLGVGVETISEGVFAGCTKLTGLAVADGNSTYCSENNVIYTTDKKTLVCGAGGLTGTLAIPAGVQTIVSYAFFDCTGLTGVLTIPDSVQTIGEGVFAGCTKLTGMTVADGNSTYCSENNVIYTTDKQTLVCGAGGLTGTLTIPNSVQTISSYAFYGCTSLTKAVFTAPTEWAVYDDSEYTKKSRDISVADAETAAEYLCKDTNKGGYANKWWKKN